VWFFPGSVSAQSDASSNLSALIEEAKQHNPKIQSAFNAWKAAQYKTTVSQSLEDPMVSYSYMGDEVQTRVGPQEQRFGVSQKIPFPGKLGLKGKAQSKEAQVLQERYEAIQNEIIKEVKFVYYDLYWVDRSIEVNEEEKAVLERLEKVAQRKYESNLSTQPDVIKIQIELSNVIEKLFLLRQNRESLNVRLNSLLNRGSSEKILKVSEISAQEFNYSLEEVLEKAQHSRQELIAAALAVEKAQYEQSLAKMSYLPDFTVGAEFIDIGSGATTMVNDGEDAWMGTVSVNLPIWFWKNDAQIKEKKAALETARKDQKDIENQVAFEVQDLYFKISAYQDVVLLYETALLPQAEQAFDVSQTGFEAGVLSFIDWLDTERTYLQTRLAYYKVVTDYHKSVAYLERAIGEDL